MVDIRSRNNISIWDEATANTANVDTDGDLNVKSKLWDGTNEVTVTGNKLDVNGTFSENVRPGPLQMKHLKNNSSFDMNVDGSTTPVSFTVSAATGKTFYVNEVHFVIVDNDIEFSKFGGISGGLTTGLEFKVTENGTERSLYEENITKNSTFYHFTNVSLFSDIEDMQVAILNLEHLRTSFELKDSTSDNLKVIVNDDLTSIDHFEVVALGYEV